MGLRSLKELCDEKGTTIEELSQKVEFDVVDFEYRAHNDKIDTETGKEILQGIVLKEAVRICEVLGIQVKDLFEKTKPKPFVNPNDLI